MTSIVDYYIGSGVDDHYSTLQEWWRDIVLQSGDLVSNDIQVNAYLRGGQSHPIVSGIPPYYDGSFLAVPVHYLLMETYVVNVDETHYFQIAAEPGYEFYGTFDDPNIPYLYSSGNTGFTSKGGIWCNVPYTKLSNFIIKDIDFRLNTGTSGLFWSNSAFGIIQQGEYSVTDRVGVQNIVSSQTNTGGTRSYGIYAMGGQVRNSVINDIFCTSQSGFSQAVGLAARYDCQIFNNTVSNISGNISSPTGFIVGVGYPSILGRTIVPPDEDINFGNPTMWFDTSVGPLYSGNGNFTNITQTTATDARIRRWDSIINNYSGISYSNSSLSMGWIDDTSSPKGLRLLDGVQQAQNNQITNDTEAPFLTHPKIDNCWTNGYTTASIFQIRSPAITSLNTIEPDISGTILSSRKGMDFFGGTLVLQQILDMSYVFDNITGYLYGTIKLDKDSPTIVTSVGPIYTGVWYAATLTADPYNLLKYSSAGLYLEIENIGSGFADISSITSSWNHYTTTSGDIINRLCLHGNLLAEANSNLTMTVANIKAGEHIIYRQPLPETNTSVVGRKDLRRYLYDKWVETTGVSFISPTIPSGTYYANNYAGTVTGTATHAIVGMGTGLGPVPSSNAVADTSLIVANGNLININPTDAILSNNRLSFNPSLLTTSPLLNAGVDLSSFGFNTDVGGEPRSVWDIGADERFVYTTESGIPLCMYGKLEAAENISLYMSGSNTPAKGMTLAIPYIFPISGGLNLFIKHSGIPKSNTRTLYMKAVAGKSAAGMNLHISGYGEHVNNSISLFVGQDVDPSGMNLYVRGWNAQNSGYTPLFVRGYNQDENLNLYVDGYGDTVNNNLTFFLQENTNIDPSGLNLFLSGNIRNIASGISLWMSSHNNQANLNLVMSGYGYGLQNTVNLAVIGNEIFATGAPLYMNSTEDYRKLNLFIEGEPRFSAQRSIPIYIQGDIASNLNLYLKSTSSGDYTDRLNLLLLGGGTDSENIVPLYLHNIQIGTSGWGVEQQGMNLYIARDSEGGDYTIPLTLFGHVDSNSGMNMFVQSNLTGVGNINLYIDGLPATGNTVPIYVRGF